MCWKMSQRSWEVRRGEQTQIHCYGWWLIWLLPLEWTMACRLSCRLDSNTARLVFCRDPDFSFLLTVKSRLGIQFGFCCCRYHGFFLRVDPCHSWVDDRSCMATERRPEVSKFWTTANVLSIIILLAGDCHHEFRWGMGQVLGRTLCATAFAGLGKIPNHIGTYSLWAVLPPIFFVLERWASLLT